MQYQRTVAAATAETASKFRLAEALALDIPRRRLGGDAADETKITAELEEARQEIITAGGEPRVVSTLGYYRLTALWAAESSNGTVRTFRWVPGRSFSAHSEARAKGLSFEAFAAMPKATVDTIRDQAGHAGTDGPPERIVKNWTPEEKAAVVREVVQEQPEALAGLPAESKAGLVEDWLADPEQGTKFRAAVSKPIHRHDERTERDLTERRRQQVDDGRRPDFESPEAVLRAVASAKQYLADMARLPHGLSLAARQRLAIVNREVWEMAALWKDAAPANVSDEAEEWLRAGDPQ